MSKNNKKEDSDSEDEVNSDNDEENQNEDENDEEDKKFSVTNSIDPSASFFATLVDASAFRYLVDYLLCSSTEGTFIFTKDMILFQKADEDGRIMNDVRIKTYKLTDYNFNSQNNEIITTLNLADLKNKTRSIGKKEQVNIYRLPNEPSNFYIQVRSQEKGAADNHTLFCMQSKSENAEIIEMPEYTRTKMNPNCTISQSDFSKTCKSLGTNKCSYAEIIGYEKGFCVIGYDSKNTPTQTKEFGKCPTKINGKLRIQETPIEKTRIYPKVFKALGKINGFTGSSSVINFYFEKDKPIKITCPIGGFGVLNILLR